MIDFIRDLRILARGARRAPGFFALVVGTLAAGAGGASGLLLRNC